MNYLDCEIYKMIPDDVKKTLYFLEKCGFEAFLIGGSVRDILIKRSVCDFDIATNAPPFVLTKMFENLGKIGINYGSVTLKKENYKIEITTYRKDSEYFDRRHPKKVKFVKSLKEDVERRDFTINQIAYSANFKIVDYYGGIYDLKSKIIRCIGAPYAKFSEDYIRMLRAVRFSCELGFEIEPQTLIAMKGVCKKLLEEKFKPNTNLLKKEFEKILMSDFASNIKILIISGLIYLMFPMLSGVKIRNIKRLNFENLQLKNSEICHKLTAFVLELTKILSKELSYEEKINFLFEFIKHLEFGKKVINKVDSLLKIDGCNLIST